MGEEVQGSWSENEVELWVYDFEQPGIRYTVLKGNTEKSRNKCWTSENEGGVGRGLRLNN